MSDFDQEAPTWDSNLYRVERAQAVAQGIRALVPITPRMTAFEYGCGTGLLGFALQPYLGHITLADSSSGMLAVVDEKIAAGSFDNMRSMKVDLITDSLPPLKVQMIATLMTLHHIPETGRILERFYSLLDTPGYLCVADLDQEDGSFHGPDFAGHKGFNREVLGERVREIGFHKVTFATVFHTPKKVDGVTKHFPVFLMVAEK